MRFDMHSLPESGGYVQLNQHLRRVVVFRKRILRYSFSDGAVRSCPLFFFRLTIAQIFLLRLEALPNHPRHSQQERRPRKVNHTSNLIPSRFAYVPGMMAVLMSPLRLSMCRNTCCKRERGASPVM